MKKRATRVDKPRFQGVNIQYGASKGDLRGTMTAAPTRPEDTEWPLHLY